VHLSSGDDVAERHVVTDPTAFSGAPGRAPEPKPQAESQTALLEPQQPANLWLHRISVFLFVLISAVAGVLLIILPWTPEWTDNYLLLTFPALRSIVSNGFFRGICSGLGLLDIWIGFWEALHYHEQS
jgi:hypothetical protein